MKELNLIGQKYNMLTVIKLDHKTKKSMNYWICRCDCGKNTVVSTHNLRMNAVKSCGCLDEFLEWVGRIYNNFYVNQYEELKNLKL